MEQNQNQFKCTGNCLECLPIQRAYCASQHSYSNMKVLDSMMTVVLELKGTVDELKVKIEAIQGNEASLFDPTTQSDSDERPISILDKQRLLRERYGNIENSAQSGDGAA